jgi:hypothetical protein
MPSNPTKKHTRTAERIHHLICLLLVVELPSLIEGTSRLSLDLRALIMLSEIETVKDKNQIDPQVLKCL